MNVFANFLISGLSHQALLHKNEIVQYFQAWRCYDIDQPHFGKPLKISTWDMKIYHSLTTAHSLRTVQLLTYFYIKARLLVGFLKMENVNALDFLLFKMIGKDSSRSKT